MQSSHVQLCFALLACVAPAAAYATPARTAVARRGAPPSMSLPELYGNLSYTAHHTACHLLCSTRVNGIGPCGLALHIMHYA
jgi:hypothetical protein